MTSATATKTRNKTILAVFTLFVLGMFALNVARMATHSNDAVAELKQRASAAVAEQNRRTLPLADVRFVDEHGMTRSLADVPHRPLLLNVWATWCPPCREELPDLDRLQQQLGGENFQVMALSVDEGGLPAVERFLRQVNVTSLHPYVATREGSQALRVSALPTTLLIDARGREVWRISGALPWSREDVVDILRAAITDHR